MAWDAVRDEILLVTSAGTLTDGETWLGERSGCRCASRVRGDRRGGDAPVRLPASAGILMAIKSLR
jgi:hypothetical protein